MEVEDFIVKALLAFIGGIIGFIGSYYGMVAMVKTTLKVHDDCIKSIDCDIEIMKKDISNKIEKDDIRRVHEKIELCQLKVESDKSENRVHDDLGEIKTSIKDLTNKVDKYLLEERKLK